MKTVICLYIFLISLHNGLLNDVIETEITIENEVHTSLEDKRMCTCSKSYCVCCGYLNWKRINVNGLICVGVKYMEESVGATLSVTYNNTVIIQQNLSFQKLFPICVKENIVGILPGSICIQMNDVILTSENVHACFQVEGYLFSINLPTMKLGCVNITKNTIDPHYVKNIYQSLIDWYKRKINNVSPIL